MQRDKTVIVVLSILGLTGVCAVLVLSGLGALALYGNVASSSEPYFTPQPVGDSGDVGTSQPPNLDDANDQLEAAQDSLDEMTEAAFGEEPTNVTVRVSGTTGVEYSGTYTTLATGTRTTERTLGESPDEYEMVIHSAEEGWDSMSARLYRKSPDGNLKLEVLHGGEIVAVRETSESKRDISLECLPPASDQTEVTCEDVLRTG